MKINIVTSGRFHVLDLARELDRLGHEVAFYSYVPQKRAEDFGLPGRCHRSLLKYLAPIVGFRMATRNSLGWRSAKILEEAVDELVARIIDPCDVFIGMSGLCIKSAEKAREKYGATIFIERGSRHILSQKSILDAIHPEETSPVPDYAVQRELASYDQADIITVPSRHVVESFVEFGISEEKLFRNPYGVDLQMFPPSEKPESDFYDVLMVGTWGYQKGCDVLIDACRDSKKSFLHVGGLSDSLFPKAKGYQHVESVNQPELYHYYEKSKIFCLPSRQDGFGMVLSQALSCGLPLVCTHRTGGEDLREYLDDPKWITVVPVDDVKALREGIKTGLEIADSQPSGKRDILGPARDKLSWAAYGKRYADELIRRV